MSQDSTHPPAHPTLQEALQAAGECCITALDPAHDYLPMSGYEAAHDLGRWWNAMPRLEAATGFKIPAEVEQAMARNLRRMTDNEDALLVNNPAIAGLENRASLNLHNLREGLYSFAALVRFRGDGWARQRGHALVETIAAQLLPNGGIDVRQLKMYGKLPKYDDRLLDPPATPTGWYDSSASTGRCLEALVYFHQFTGDPLALELAGRIARAIVPHLLTADGQICPGILQADHVGHNHSFLGTLRGLLDYGLLVGDTALVEAVNRTYRRGVLSTLVSETGWTPHDLGNIRFPNNDGDPVAENASSSDVVQLALTLAARAGQTDLWDDVERLVRVRLLPAQVMTRNDVHPYGAWGVNGEPHARGFIFDVSAAVLATMIEVYHHVMVADERGLWLHLHFPICTPLAEVTAIRTDRAVVTIRPAKPTDLYLRIPGWSPPNQVRLTVSGINLPVRWSGHYAQVLASDYEEGQTVELSYALPVRRSIERMPVSGKEYHLTWRGDEIIHCQPPVPIWPA